MTPSDFQQQSETWFSFLKGFVDGFLIPTAKLIASFGQFLFNHPAWTIALLVGALAIALLIKYAWKVGVVGAILVLLVMIVAISQLYQRDSASGSLGSGVADNTSEADVWRGSFLSRLKEFGWKQQRYEGTLLSEDLTNIPVRRDLYHPSIVTLAHLSEEQKTKNVAFSLAPSVGECKDFPEEGDSLSLGLQKLRRLAALCPLETAYAYIQYVGGTARWMRVGKKTTGTTDSVPLDPEKMKAVIKQTCSPSVKIVIYFHTHPRLILNGRSVPAPPSGTDLLVYKGKTFPEPASTDSWFTCNKAWDQATQEDWDAYWAPRQKLVSGVVDSEGVWLLRFTDAFASEMFRYFLNKLEDSEQFPRDSVPNKYHRRISPNSELRCVLPSEVINPIAETHEILERRLDPRLVFPADWILPIEKFLNEKLLFQWFASVFNYMRERQSIVLEEYKKNRPFACCVY